MQPYWKKVGAIMVAGTLFVGLLGGCTKGDSGGGAVPEGTSTAKEGDTVLGLPIVDKPLTLKTWVTLGGSKVITNYSEMAMYKELEKRTGIHFEFIHPPAGQEKENLNLLIASGDLPDIIENNLSYYSGGMVKAYADGIIVSLNDLIDQYAPNYKKALAANKEAQKDAKTDDGKYLAFWELRALNVSNEGLVIRKDWLDELGLKMPVTMEDWYTVLKAFKEKKGVKIPYTGDSNLPSKYAFSGAYGVVSGFMQGNGRVLYGAVDPRFKEYLTTLRKWYVEGLIDPEFATNNSKTIEAKMTAGQSGAMFGFQSGNLAGYMTLARPKTPGYSLVGTSYPVLKEGETPRFAPLTGLVNTGTCAVITTACKYPKEAARVLDYGYSEEGILLTQFGIEGASYKMENGTPKLTELITKSPEGISTALYKYSRGAGNRYPSVLSDAFAEQIRLYKEQGDAIELWSKPKNANSLPSGLSLTPEETAKTSSKLTEMETYKSEMLLKFIMGQEPLEKFDAYVETIKKMGLEECIKVRQGALDRYNER